MRWLTRASWLALSTMLWHGCDDDREHFPAGAPPQTTSVAAGTPGVPPPPADGGSGGDGGLVNDAGLSDAEGFFADAFIDFPDAGGLIPSDAS